MITKLILNILYYIILMLIMIVCFAQYHNSILSSMLTVVLCTVWIIVFEKFYDWMVG